MATVILILTGGYLADFLFQKGFKLINIRRGLHLVGSIIPGIVCFGFFFVGCNFKLAVGLAVIIQTLLGMQHPGSKTNINDICPPYVAFVMSLGNVLSLI